MSTTHRRLAAWAALIAALLLVASPGVAQEETTTTAPPETTAPQETVPPETEPPDETTVPEESEEETGVSADTLLVLAWVLGVIALLFFVVALVRSFGRRTTPPAAPRVDPRVTDRIREAYGEGRWLHANLTEQLAVSRAVGMASGDPDTTMPAADAETWRSIPQHMAAATTRLYELETDATDEGARRKLAAAQSSIRGLREALDDRVDARLQLIRAEQAADELTLQTATADDRRAASTLETSRTVLEGALGNLTSLGR